MPSQSFMRHAVTISTPASAESGRRAITPPSRNIEASRNSEWNTLVRRVCWPDLTATLVRAMAAVAGTPPKSGSRILPTPCAISS